MDRDDPAWLHQPRPTWPPEPDAHFSELEHRSGYQQENGLTSWLSDNRMLATTAVLGFGALAGLAAYSYLSPSRPKVEDHPEPQRQPDDAPGRTARQTRFGDFAVSGRAVTINVPRAELYAFWRDFSNLAKFMENIERVREEGDVSVWTIRAPLGMTMAVRSRIVNEKEGEQIAWRSTEDSDIETEGKVMFRDAPGDRGTIVEAIVAYKPPMGALGQVVAKLFSAEPSIQSRRDLKRLKMLLETGEIATSSNRRQEGGKFQKNAPQPSRQSATA